MVGVIDLYSAFVNSLPTFGKNFLNLFMLSVLILIYAVLIWKFYRFIAKKNLFNLNLNQFNRIESGFLKKLVKGFFNTIEYIVILPIAVFVWYSVFTIFLIFLTENIPVSTLLILSATVVTAVRMAAYYKEDLSRDLAKLLPFTLLGVSLTQSGLIDFNVVLSNISQIPTFFNDVLTYLAFIIIIEFVLRILEVLFLVLGVTTKEELKEVEAKD